MTFLSIYSPTGGNYYEKRELRKNIIKNSLRVIDTPFHWQFCDSRGTKYYKGTPVEIKTGSFLFDKEKQDELTVEVENLDFGEDSPVVTLCKEICEEIDRRHEDFDVIIFYDSTAITSGMENMNVLVSYGIY